MMVRYQTNARRDRSCREPAVDAFRVRLENVALRAGTRRILRGTSWTIRPGEQWLVWGPNGSGKTTLAGAVTGDIPVVEGRRRFSFSPEKRPVAARVSFDEHTLIVAREDIRDLSRAFAGDPDSQLTPGQLIASLVPQDKAETLLARTGIAHLADQPVRTLSTGEMRRLLIARAMAREPELLILDEPFDGLDEASRNHFAEMINGLMASGVQVVLITHRRSEILPGITHVIALAHGRVVFKGPVSTWGASTPVGADARDARSVEVSFRPVDAEEILRLERVTVRFGPRVVFRNLDWTVRLGENWAVTGPNGAGKTTLVGLLTGDHPQAYANRIHLFGRRRGTGETIWEIKSRIGIVSPDLQVRYRRKQSGNDVVVSGFFDSIGLYRRVSEAQRLEANQWLERLGIQRLAERRFDRLSTGEKRMVLFARAMVKKPDLLILDEPCQGLDTDNRRQVLETIDRIAASSLTSLIYVTHHRDERPRCITHELALPVSIQKGSFLS